MKRLALVTAAALAGLLAFAIPAAAHVTVSAPGATPGGTDQEITFRVPVEKNTATVGLTLALPTATPILGVEIQAMPGWTHRTKTVKLAQPIKTDDGDITSAVSQIVWRARAGQGLRPGEFGAFTIIAGQLPNAPALTFKALQFYRDGSVVKWIEVAAPGSSAEPENPAPVLMLDARAAAPAKAAESSSDTGPVMLSIVALALAATALSIAVITRAKSRQ